MAQNVASIHRINALSYSLFISIGWTSVLVPTLILAVEHFYHQTDVALGIFYASTALAGAAGALICALATERVGRRVITPLVTLLLGLGLIGQSMAPSWTLFFIAAVLANIGAGALDGDINGLFLDLHSDGQTGGALNLLHLFFSAGAVGGAFLIGLLVNLGASWRGAIGVTGVLVVFLAAVSLTLPLPSGRRAAVAPKPSGPIGIRERSLVPFAGLAIAICLYVGAELGVTSWVVKYVAQSNISLAAIALSAFWGGITLGRLLASRTADSFNAVSLTIGCCLASAVTLTGAILSPHIIPALMLYGLTGLFYGPIFPMIMVIGGRLYPHRLALLSGSLSAAATVGAIIYPGLMGFISAHQGIRLGMLGAAGLAILTALALLAAVSFKSAAHHN